MKGKRVLIFQQRAWGVGAGHYFAKRLQEEGAELAALTLKQSTHAFTLSQKEVHYQLVVNNDQLMMDPKAYLGEDDYSLEEICQELGEDSIWPMVQSLRNHVKSYQDKFYYSFRQNLPDEEIIDYVKAVYKCARHIFDEFNPQVILGLNFVALPQIFFSLYARTRGCRFVAIHDSKVQGISIFSTDHRYTEGSFHRRLEALNQGQVESDNRQRAKGYIAGFRDSFKIPLTETPPPPMSAYEKFKDLLRPYIDTVYWLRSKPVNRMANFGPTIDHPTPRIIVRDHYSRKRYRRSAENRRYFPVEGLSKYVYFPLQVQPEHSIDVAAPYFSNQIETARLLAMSLPGDYVLAVKDHPAMAELRPPSYLEKVARTPNVKLLDFRIPSERLLKGAALVISPNSTTLSEATFFHIPAIQLGDLGTTLKLPNVFFHSDIRSIATKIKTLLATDFHTEAYERQLENFVAAAFDTGLTCDYYGKGSDGQPAMEELYQGYRREVVQIFAQEKGSDPS
ncbi:MAG: hypothetical protein HQL52_10940 [Magnetococcales bacterium]|nr:hypothetical protein [Magnetococcales bacterium]